LITLIENLSLGKFAGRWTVPAQSSTLLTEAHAFLRAAGRSREPWDVRAAGISSRKRWSPSRSGPGSHS